MNNKERKMQIRLNEIFMGWNGPSDLALTLQQSKGKEIFLEAV